MMMLWLPPECQFSMLRLQPRSYLGKCKGGVVEDQTRPMARRKDATTVIFSDHVLQDTKKCACPRTDDERTTTPRLGLVIGRAFSTSSRRCCWIIFVAIIGPARGSVRATGAIRTAATGRNEQSIPDRQWRDIHVTKCGNLSSLQGWSVWV